MKNTWPILLAGFFLLMSSLVWAHETLSFSKAPADVNVSQLADELEDFTGLVFMSPCSTCTINGYIEHAGNNLKVVTFTSAVETEPEMPVISSVTWTDQISSSITTKVNAHVPE